MRLNITRSNRCPGNCEHYDNEGNGHYAEYCCLPDGTYKIEIKDGKLKDCPLGKWPKD